jgi:hypothetical protein
MKSIIGKYDVARKEGPLHRSPHSPHRLLDLADGASTLYDNFRYAATPTRTRHAHHTTNDTTRHEAE